MLEYDAALTWVSEARTSASDKPKLLLGNGFSVAFDPARFSYGALFREALDHGKIGATAERFFEAFETTDFELVIQRLTDVAAALKVIDQTAHASLIADIEAEAAQVKEALAQTLAGLHPERPQNVTNAAYERIRAFLGPYKAIYTANYDLLLYWALMHDDAGPSPFGRADDGFRDPGYEAEYVTWDNLAPRNQTVHYLHGALHLYRNVATAELQKLTWARTQEALIDQIRRQLDAGTFPLIVTEGTSTAKLAKIETSDYLSHARRSLAAIGGGIIAYGLSFSPNDAHIMSAIVRSNLKRIAVSIYGDPSSEMNRLTIQSARSMSTSRAAIHAGRPLEVEFFDAATVSLWAGPSS